MYIPKQYEGQDRTAALSFMKRFNFATIVNTGDGKPEATHLPFSVQQEGEKLILRSHFARANAQWQHISKGESLVIFQEPHAYISTKHYNKLENVPTWNYLAVHAYGKAQIISEEEAVFGLLEEMMDQFEPAYKQQWEQLSMHYKSKMAKGIVAFELTVIKLLSKEKLSQNKKENERQSIINTFKKSDDMNEQTIADYMMDKEKNN